MVVRGSLWRMATCMSRIGTPATRPVVQKVRRRLCGLIRWSMPARALSRRSRRAAPPMSRRCPKVLSRVGLAAVGGFADGPEHRDRQRDIRGFGAFTENVEDLVARLVADVVDVGMT